MPTVYGSCSNSKILTWFDWQEVNVDTANNQSQINIQVYAKRNDSYESYGTGSGNININGNNHGFSITSSMRINSTGVCLASWSCVVHHEADGSKSCYIAATWSIPNISTSTPPWGGDYSLTQIARKSNPSLSSTNFNIGNNVIIYTNRASASFVHDIYMYNGSSYDLLASNVGDSWTWNTSNIYYKIPNDVTFY